MTITIGSPCGRGPVMGSSSYNAEEADNILRAAPLMTEAELMRRLTFQVTLLLIIHYLQKHLKQVYTTYTPNSM
jgi:hypothetical protein